MIYDYRDFQNVFGQGDYGVRPTSVAGAETTQTSSWGDVLGGTATNFLGNEGALLLLQTEDLSVR